MSSKNDAGSQQINSGDTQQVAEPTLDPRLALIHSVKEESKQPPEIEAQKDESPNRTEMKVVTGANVTWNVLSEVKLHQGKKNGSSARSQTKSQILCSVEHFQNTAKSPLAKGLQIDFEKETPSFKNEVQIQHTAQVVLSIEEVKIEARKFVD